MPASGLAAGGLWWLAWQVWLAWQIWLAWQVWLAWRRSAVAEPAVAEPERAAGGSGTVSTVA